MDEIRQKNTELQEMKYPYLKLFTGDWLKDPRLSMCSPATRGVWIDLICAMHEFDRSGILRGTSEELARLARCSTVQLESALTDLQNKLAADVEQRNGNWTIANRRMQREADLQAKRARAGSKGGSKTQANRERTPYDYDCDSESDALEKVRGFAKGKGIAEQDADWFFWKGNGNGWTNRGEPILDWKATLFCWFRAGYLPSQKQGANGRTPLMPECLRMSPPRDWQEAKRVVRHLSSKKAEFPAYAKQISDKIEALTAQFKLS